ncbi:MAG: hypothetical protein K8R36_06850, partial [Planctomycetales bacterium]|nr:hypothetical protein [Planctomycetales bacterium]
MLAFRRFIVALFAIGLVFGVYALLVAPWLEPPAVETAKYTGEKDHYDSSLSVRKFDDLFAEGSWELDDPKVIETATCTMLLKDYRVLPDGRMEISPCTLIFYMAPTKAAVITAAKEGAKKPERRRVVMRALQGALLEFDRPLDVGRAEFGRLMGGELKGSVQITSPPTGLDTNDDLEVNTKNVKIDRQRIYTPHEVNFRYGASEGVGSDLTITLLPADDDKQVRAQSLGGISYLQLSRLKSLHLEGAGGLIRGSSPSKDARNEMPLEVRCQGPLIVDFDHQQARLDEQVEVTRIYPQGPPDKLTCDRLLFRLAGKSAKKPAGSTPAQSRELPPPKTQSPLAKSIDRIIAVGTPTIIDAPQSGLFVKAASVDYTVGTRLVRLSNGPTGAPVILRQGKNRFEARAIEYESGEPGRLGKLMATGPGELEFVQESGEALQATWKKSLHMRPHDGSQAISLLDDAHVAGPMGEFSAAELHLWLKEIARPAKVAAAGTSPAKPSFILLPERMLALSRKAEPGESLDRGVDIDAPQLKARTNRLEAWFAEPTPEQQATAAAHSGGGLPGMKPARPAPEVTGEGNAEAAPSAPMQKLSVSGDLVQLQILRLKGKPAVEDLAITGKVQVDEIQTEKPEDVPLKLSGDAVTIVRGSGPSAKLEVKGRPAQVSARGLTLSGATIHLHRGENRLWIDGPGEAELPVPQEGLQMRTLQPPPGENPVSAPANLPATGAATEIRRVKVTWTKGMNFDGLRATFEGKVQARGEGEYAAAETLSVTLTQRIDFTAPKQAGPVEIALLTLDGGKSPVVLQQVSRDKEGKQTSLDNLRTGKLTVDRVANTLTAEGPGEVWTVRKDPPGLVPMSPDTPQKPEDKLTYICVKFEGGINGKLDTHEIRFERQVDTTYGKVNDWKDRLFATKTEDLGPTGAHMTSDALTVTEMSLSKAQKWVELEATGNVIVDGTSFTARAARIGYTSDKDQLVLEGDGRNDAEFWHQAGPGKDHSYTAAG